MSAVTSTDSTLMNSTIQGICQGVSKAVSFVGPYCAKGMNLLSLAAGKASCVWESRKTFNVSHLSGPDGKNRTLITWEYQDCPHVPIANESVYSEKDATGVREWCVQFLDTKSGKAAEKAQEAFHFFEKNLAFAVLFLPDVAIEQLGAHQGWSRLRREVCKIAIMAGAATFLEPVLFLGWPIYATKRVIGAALGVRSL